MRADLQSAIAPPEVPMRTPDLVTRQELAQQKVPANKIDFRDLLLNSNIEAKQRRDSDKSGTLEGAKDYQEFLNQVNKKDEALRVPKNSLDKDDFLKLFVTQLQNQDPLNPKDGTEMASQLAQFNGLEQMMNVNKSLERLEQTNQRGQNLSLVNSIGKNAYLKDSRLALHDGKTNEILVETSQPIDNALLEIRDAKGKTIMKKQLGNLAEGKHQLSWDGKDESGALARDGIYSVAVNTQTNEGQQQPLTVFSKVRIQGVDLLEKSGTFQTELGKVKLDDILSLEERKEPIAAKAPLPQSTATMDPQGEKAASQLTAVPPVLDQSKLQEYIAEKQALVPRPQPVPGEEAAPESDVATVTPLQIAHGSPVAPISSRQ